MAGMCVWHLSPCNFPTPYKNPVCTDSQPPFQSGVFPIYFTETQKQKGGKWDFSGLWAAFYFSAN